MKVGKAPAAAIVILALGAALAATYWKETGFREARRAVLNRFLSAATATAITSTPVEMNGSQPLTVPMELTLAGEVWGVPDGAPISATVYVGGRAFNANVVGRQYTAAVSALRAGDMAVVEVVAPKVRYRAVLGSYASSSGLPAATVGSIWPTIPSCRFRR